MNILGPSQATLEQAQAWAHLLGAHARFIAVAVHYWQLAPAFGIAADVAYGQASWETNFGRYTGVVPWTHHNWCGLKTKDGWSNTLASHHQVFATDRLGVIAHLWHLYGYAGGAVADGPSLPMNDPRFERITRFTHTVEGLGGPDSWAPDPGYGQRVAARIESIRDYAKEHPVGDLPGVAFVPADERHFTVGRRDPWPTKIIGHHSDGFDSLGWLTTSPNSDVSATLLLWHNGTIRAQLVKLADTPHTTGYMNDDSLSFEWERYWATQKHISDEQYANIADSVAQLYLAERRRGNPFFAGPLLRDHLADHNDYYGTTCPGNLDMGRVWELARGLVDPRPVDELIINGFKIVAGFKGFWEELLSYERTLPIRVLGLPLGNEFAGLTPNTSYQEFERGWLKWDASEPAPYHIHLKLTSEEAPGARDD